MYFTGLAVLTVLTCHHGTTCLACVTACLLRLYCPVVDQVPLLLELCDTFTSTIADVLIKVMN